MTNLRKKIRPIEHWLMLIPLILSGMWFQLLEKTIHTPDVWLYVRLDDYIPFVPLFVIPYVLWYIYVAGPAVYLFFKSPSEFKKNAAFLALGMFIACAVYTLLPNGQALRPSLAGMLREPFVGLIRYLYHIDTPTNSAPSIHVIYSFAAHFAITRINNTQWKIRFVNATSFVVCVLCSISTVFVKQHSVIDVAAGLAVSYVLYRLVYKRADARSDAAAKV